MRSFVFPGEKLTESVKNISNTYSEEGNTYSKVFGLFDDSSKNLIPLKSAWVPRLEDRVIGIVSSKVKRDMYQLYLNDFIDGLLISESRYDEFNIGDIVVGTVEEIERRTTVIVEQPMLLKDGIIININSAKIPRLMGKENTMISEITDLTHTQISVGKNGLIWIKGDEAAKAIKAIKQVESEAHVGGLTDRIKDSLTD